MTYYSEKDIIIGYNSNDELALNNSTTIQEDIPEEVLLRITTTCRKLENTINNHHTNDFSKLEDFETFLNK